MATGGEASSKTWCDVLLLLYVCSIFYVYCAFVVLKYLISCTVSKSVKFLGCRKTQIN